MRRELLSYLDTRDVYELANVDEMAPEMKKKLFRGADILKGLKQYKFAGRTPEEMIAYLYEDHWTSKGGCI